MGLNKWLKNKIKESKEQKALLKLKQNTCLHEWWKKSYYAKGKASFSLIGFLFGQVKELEIEDEYYICLVCGKTDGYVEIETSP